MNFVSTESKTYIGFKMIQAAPMTGEDAETFLGRSLLFDNAERICTNPECTESFKAVHPGYLVEYPDGYRSWSPKAQFEAAYMQVGDNNTIANKNVEDFISSYETYTLGKKTTVVKAILANGFVLVESSSCIDVANYDLLIGQEICLERIRNRVWELLGFLLQTAQNGLKP